MASFTINHHKKFHTLLPGSLCILEHAHVPHMYNKMFSSLNTVTV